MVQTHKNKNTQINIKGRLDIYFKFDCDINKILDIIKNSNVVDGFLVAVLEMVRALLVKCEKGKLRNITYYNYKPSEYWQLLICCTELVYMGVSIIETKLVAQLFKNKLQRTIHRMFGRIRAVPKILIWKAILP
jgi:hypothetical protein